MSASVLSEKIHCGWGSLNLFFLVLHILHDKLTGEICTLANRNAMSGEMIYGLTQLYSVVFLTSE